MFGGCKNNEMTKTQQEVAKFDYKERYLTQYL